MISDLPQVVSDYSGKFNRPAIEQVFVLQDKHHMNMCKFQSADYTGYKDFCYVLNQYLQMVAEKQRISQQQQKTLTTAEVCDLMYSNFFISFLNLADRPIPADHQFSITPIPEFFRSSRST